MKDPFAKVRIPAVRVVQLLLVTAISSLLVGCISFDGKKHHRKTSTAQFLYPTEEGRVVQAGIPRLSLPLRVGIAFVPSAKGYSRSALLGEARKSEMMEAVAERFRDRPFIKEIEMIPTTYLRPGGGFKNLDQLKNMFDIDVIALVGYDQIQNSDNDAWSLTYWTIVGAYFVPAAKNDTATMLDTAVFDIASRKLLFRAPGISQIKGRAAMVNVNERMRKDALKGLDEANDTMIENLDLALDQFKQRVKEKPAEYQVVHKPGYTGGGSFGAGSALVMLVLLGAASRSRRGDRS
jgi:rhombotail lipoprotein